MISRQTREAAGGVLSFTFLDVLTCTMGSLVLLVVVLGEKAANTRLEDALRNGPKIGSQTASADQAAAPATTSLSADEAATKLAELRKQEAELASLRKKAAERLDEETARVRHLEEHQRRLEHELAQLHIALERLQEAEQKQTVDQATAERELERLKQLIVDVEKQLKDIREQPAGNKSYAIVPYGGKFGTHRRPIYIECTADEAIIQPEGIRFTMDDLTGPIRSGNPLASAVRAAHYELNERARAAGQQEMPDPYPLILVRPEGAVTFWAVQQAIESWDVQYGYELIESDWDLEFPETDPRLVQCMTHAAGLARERQALLAKAAPRTYGGMGSGMSAPAVARREHGESERGPREMQSYGGSTMPGNTIGGSTTSPLIGSSIGGGSAGLESSSTDGMSGGNDEPNYGSPPSGAVAGAGSFANQFGDPGGMSPTPPSTGASAAADQMASAASGGTSPDSMALSAPAPIDVHAAPKDPAAPGGASGRVGDASVAKSDKTDSLEARDRKQVESAAKSRGANWANEAATLRATPVTRPIRVIVSRDQLQLMPDDGSSFAESITVSFHQPTDKVLDDLVAAVREQTEDWGLAGQSMYWRPTLVLQVAPGADRHAIGLHDLLRDSGLDVRFQETATAARPTAEPTHGTR